MAKKYNWIKNHSNRMYLLGQINGLTENILLLYKQKDKYEKRLKKYKEEEEQNERGKNEKTNNS
tara:strand:+ start:433 stop:624 length:192 start_codon:yes stop_codon:yes gene_type:complete